MHYIENITPEIRRIMNATFPLYKGTKISVLVCDREISLASGWEGGSKDYHRVINLATMEVVCIPENGHHWCQPGAYVLKTIPQGFAVVRHEIICGKDCGLVILVHPSTMCPMLEAPKPDGLSEDEKLVLAYTRGLKSSYGGISQYRFHCLNRRKGMSRKRYDEARETLTKNGLLNGAGAITAKGKNVLEATNPRWHYEVM